MTDATLAPPSEATAPPTASPSTHDGTFDHGPRSRFNAWFFRAFDRYIDHITHEQKLDAFRGITSRELVELGAGVGANFDHLPRGARVVAVEPNRAMHDELRARAAARGIDVTVVGVHGDRLPIPDGATDEVVCSLVLCTVPDPAATLAEVRRVLRPGGRFRFVEHVAAPAWSPRRWLQHAIRRPWSWVFEGCDLCRDTASTIEAAGFRDVRLHRGKLRRSLFVPVNTVVSGRAVR